MTATIKKAMLFTSPRDITIASLSGHAIEFKKGVPTHVPRECWKDVQAQGCVPEEAAAMDEKKAVVNEDENDPVYRKEQIMAAFAAMKNDNKREDFAASGVPNVKKLSQRVGFNVDSKERDSFWPEFMQGDTGE